MAENGQDMSDQLINIAGSRPSSSAKGKTMHWFAYVGPDPPDVEEDAKSRLKSVKERENEERQKKLDELKAQAQAAQRFKEKKEMERRQRIGEMKLKEDVRRQQVEERKKMMNDAERDRLEAILRRNQEREARIEAKRRNERHSMVFAFGSSTPRMLQPTDSIGSFWGHRRATSTQNITCTAAPLTRRQSERELDGGSKKRATSAGGLERSLEGATSPQVPAGCASGYVGRRRTDLMPTIPSRDAPSAPPRKSFARSPGRAYSMSRLDQLAKPRKRPELPSLAETTTSPPLCRPLNRPQQSSVSRSMSHLAVSKAGPQSQRPLRKSDSRSMHQLSAASPLPPPRTTRATQLRQQKLATTNHEAPSRPTSSLSQQSTSSVTSSINLRTRPVAAPRRPRPVSIAVTGISTDIKNGIFDKKSEQKPPLPKTRKSSLAKSTEKLKKKSAVNSPTDSSPKLLVFPNSQVSSPVELKTTRTVTQELRNEEEITEITSNVVSEQALANKETIEIAQIDGQLSALSILPTTQPMVEISNNKQQDEPLIPELTLPVEKLIEHEPVHQLTTPAQPTEMKQPEDPVEIEETEYPPETKRQEIPEEVKQLEIKVESKEPERLVDPIQSENLLEIKPPAESSKSEKLQEEVKIENGSTNSGEFNENFEMSASMIKTRISTEEEAKAALAERRRIAREEAEKQAETERRRIEEEERLERERQHTEEEQQRILIEKLRQEEQQRLEDAIKEAQKREEEERLRREEENRIKLLKEETERRAREDAERQKAELQERLKNEEKEREARRKRVEAIMLRTRGKGNNSSPQQSDEKNEENKSEKVNGSKVDAPENGHKNEKDIEPVDNIIPVEMLKNANNTVSNVDNLSTDDTLNSNNAWQHNTQTDLLM